MFVVNIILIIYAFINNIYPYLSIFVIRLRVFIRIFTAYGVINIYDMQYAAKILYGLYLSKYLTQLTSLIVKAQQP